MFTHFTPRRPGCDSEYPRLQTLPNSFKILRVRDVSQRLERGAGRFLIPQINREKLNVAAAGQLGLAA